MGKNGIQMCKQKLVLETIKKTKGNGGMTPAQIKLAEAQVEDYQDLKNTVVETKNTVSELKQDFGYLKGQIDILVRNSSKTGFQLALELIRTKGFWTVATIVSVLYFCGKYNMNPAELIKHLFTGG